MRNDLLAEMKFKNIQQPTTNTQHPKFSRGNPWMFDVGCWLLDVSFNSFVLRHPPL
jgi:hypothetical protein